MMLTRCPQCATAFRVSAEQLKVKQGKVRCGQCRHVFNALETLVDEPDPTLAAASTVDTSDANDARHTSDTSDASDASDQGAANSSASPVDAPATFIDPEPLPEPVAGKAAEQTWPAYQNGAYVPSSLNLSMPAPSRSRVWLWAPATVLALLLLLLQAGLHFRSELALNYPGAKTLLAEVCALFGYDLPLPRNAALLTIEASDLHPGNATQLVLGATLKNRAPYTQAYPDLELTLTDIADQALLRKVMAPSDYLPPGIDAAAGFTGNADLAFNLAFETDLPGASGYRIYVFYR